MNIKEYIGDLVGGSLFLTESRIIAESLLKDLSDDKWKSLIIENNILQKKSGQTAIRYARTIRCRIEGLGEKFITELLTANERAYIQMLMMSLLIHSPVIADFMRLTLAEARRIYKPALTADAWSEFYDSRMRAYAELGGFSDSTIKKMGNNAIKALVDSAYLSDSRTKKIQPVYLMPEVKDWLVRLGREDLIDVMECTI
ncbi:DUF1819 family protein [Yersinia enterocolitica]|uniref:DUF1819 family protein n=1 Tax=Yersinia TaxID=629 RepID=UPI0005DDF0D7|nr:DUF1819 family protein [Yersinia intermedia]EKN3400898.1 DUF1819 family protein [Yersinia enterocolitica]EKN3487195.1 DUF1819 family protein [Yersinia enterocolitica]EKN3995301.1 DUF1819 family protein [Yersinia enterocolitica]EKN5085497.1 DUF1819 family protein [Yersinia enterocolitica]EKN6403352.1 DUF1819 family protein [Yersinia enterocolitica]